MSRVVHAKNGLLTLFEYEPEVYVDEINEIIDCITENRTYDNAPSLRQSDLVCLLESLKISLISEAYPDMNIKKFNTKGNEQYKILLQSVISKDIVTNSDYKKGIKGQFSDAKVEPTVVDNVLPPASSV